MFQIYIKISDENKWTEEFETYGECEARISELVSEFESSPNSYMSVIDPNGTTLMEVSN